MATKPTSKDPHALLPLKFQEFVQKFPDAALEKAKIRRAAFVAVSMMLSRHGEFKTGERIRPSVGTLADESGLTKPTVRKVVAYLQQIGVLVKTGEHRNPGGGTPVAEYRLYYSPVVATVLEINDRDYVSGKQRTTAEVAVENREPLSVNQGTTEWKTENHNRDHRKRKESSEAKAPSLSPSSLDPSGRSEEREEENDSMDDKLDQAFMEPSFEELLAGIDEEPALPVATSDEQWALLMKDL